MTDQPTATAVLERPEDRPQSLPLTPMRGPIAAPAASPVDRVLALNERYAPVLLRLALAVVFVWFGALKLMGVSPVHELIGALVGDSERAGLTLAVQRVVATGATSGADLCMGVIAAAPAFLATYVERAAA